MGEAADRAPKAPSTAEHGARQRREPPAADGFLSGGGEVFRLLHDAVGNQVVSRLIGSDAPDPGDEQAPRRPGPSLRRQVGLPAGRMIGRQPNASMPPPNQSTMPQAAGMMNNGIQYQGATIFPDADSCKALLKKQLPEKGFEGASSYGHSFLSPPSEVRAGWALFADEGYVQRCQDAMRSAVTAFDEDCRIFMETFEMKAGNITDAMLTNAEEQIHKEQEKLGMQAKVEATEGAVSTTYTATNKGYLAEAKNAAAALGTRREEVDALGRKSAEARRKVEQARR